MNQMYEDGLQIIPFPPLANEGFFRELNDSLQEAIEEMKIIHEGGSAFLDHYKLIMSKLNIRDFSKMSGEQAKIRMKEIRENLKNAVTAGCIADLPSSIGGDNGVMFQPGDDQNLMLLDGNVAITISDDDIFAAMDTTPSIKAAVDAYSESDPSGVLHHDKS